MTEIGIAGGWGAAVAGGVADAAGVAGADGRGNTGGAFADVCGAADSDPFVRGDGFQALVIVCGCGVQFAGGRRPGIKHRLGVVKGLEVLAGGLRSTKVRPTAPEPNPCH